MNFNELIEAVRGGTMTAEAAASVAGEYALEFYEPWGAADTPAHWRAIRAIRAAAEAAKIEAKKAALVIPASVPPPDTRPVLVCRCCGEHGRSGEYPFSTNPRSGLCDDCA